MDEDATWYEGKPNPGDIVLDGDTAPAKGGGTAACFRSVFVVAKRSPSRLLLSTFSVF